MCNNHTWVTKTGIDRTAEEGCKDKHVWVCVSVFMLCLCMCVLVCGVCVSMYVVCVCKTWS